MITCMPMLLCAGYLKLIACSLSLSNSLILRFPRSSLCLLRNDVPRYVHSSMLSIGISHFCWLLLVSLPTEHTRILSVSNETAAQRAFIAPRIDIWPLCMDPLRFFNHHRRAQTKGLLRNRPRYANMRHGMVNMRHRTQNWRRWLCAPT